MANAHGFITMFSTGYDTQVSTKGEQLSGGQKQRVAIAQAILKNPKFCYWMKRRVLWIRKVKASYRRP